MDDEATFSTENAAPPPTATAGGIVDDLGQLSGCWGTVRPADSEIPLKLYSVLRFDPESNRYENWMLQDAGFGVIDVSILSLYTGTYEVLQEGDEQAIQVLVEETWLNDAFTGELIQEDLGPWDDVLVLTLDGDHLYEWLADTLAGAETAPEWLAYQRFDCPE